jgi:hypothetical protein
MRKYQFFRLDKRLIETKGSVRKFASRNIPNKPNDQVFLFEETPCDFLAQSPVNLDVVHRRLKTKIAMLQLFGSKFGTRKRLQLETGSTQHSPTMQSENTRSHS